MFISLCSTPPDKFVLHYCIQTPTHLYAYLPLRVENSVIGYRLLGAGDCNCCLLACYRTSSIWRFEDQVLQIKVLAYMCYQGRHSRLLLYCSQSLQQFVLNILAMACLATCFCTSVGVNSIAWHWQDWLLHTEKPIPRCYQSLGSSFPC